MTIETRAREAGLAVRTEVARTPTSPDYGAFVRRAAAARVRRRAAMVALVLAAAAVAMPLYNAYQDEVHRIAPTHRGSRPTSTPSQAPPRGRIAPQGHASGLGAGPNSKAPVAAKGAGARAAHIAPVPKVTTQLLFASGPGSGNKVDTEPNDSIYVMNDDGSGRKQLATGARPDRSPDGSRIAFVRYPQGCVDSGTQEACGDLWVMDANGGHQQKLVAKGTSPDWSPDGKRIAFVRWFDVYGGGASEPRIYVANADGSGVKQIVGTRGDDPAWSPDGSMLAFTAVGDNAYACTTVSVWEFARSSGHSIPAPGCYARFPDWSPDGEKLAFSSSRGDNSLDFGIYTANPDGSQIRRLTPEWDGSDPHAALMPSWSFDGRRIAYMFDADGSYYPGKGGAIYCGNGGANTDCRPPGPMPGDIYVMNVDGSGVKRLGEGHQPDFR